MKGENKMWNKIAKRYNKKNKKKAKEFEKFEDNHLKIEAEEAGFIKRKKKK